MYFILSPLFVADDHWRMEMRPLPKQWSAMAWGLLGATSGLIRSTRLGTSQGASVECLVFSGWFDLFKEIMGITPH
jgi:hypothetical protein